MVMMRRFCSMKCVVQNRRTFAEIVCLKKRTNLICTYEVNSLVNVGVEDHAEIKNTIVLALKGDTIGSHIDCDAVVNSQEDVAKGTIVSAVDIGHLVSGQAVDLIAVVEVTTGGSAAQVAISVKGSGAVDVEAHCLVAAAGAVKFTRETDVCCATAVTLGDGDLAIGGADKVALCMGDVLASVLDHLLGLGRLGNGTAGDTVSTALAQMHDQRTTANVALGMGQEG